MASVTEDRWLASTHIEYMLDGCKTLRVLNARRSRLFACGCFRLIWEEIQDPHIRQAVEMTEGRADRQVTDQQLAHHRYTFSNMPLGSFDQRLQMAVMSLVIPNMNPGYVSWLVRVTIDRFRFGFDSGRYQEGYQPQADLLREIIGNPFRPFTLNPGWLTSTVVALAKQMYETRDFSAMPILADALQDVGCEDADLLAHCRGPGPHMRGCHAVDSLLKKK